MTLNQPNDTAGIERAFESAIREHWALFLIEGIVLLVLGIAAILVPMVATIAFTILIGWLFLISGVVGLITTFWMRRAPGFCQHTDELLQGLGYSAEMIADLRQQRAAQ